MEKDSQKNVVNHFEAGSNCQVFNGNITGCVFAMPGSTVTQQQAPVNPGMAQPAVAQDKGQPDVVMLARAIENCQEGLLSNTFRNNPYMRLHVDKWAQNGVKQRVLRLMDAYKDAVEKRLKA